MLLDSITSGISTQKLVLFFGIIFLTYITRYIILNIFDRKISKIVSKTDTKFDDLVFNATKKPIGYLILLHGFYAAIKVLEIPETIDGFDIEELVHNIYIIFFSIIILYFLFKLIDVVEYFAKREAEKTETALDNQLVPLLIKSLRILVITIGIIFIIHNFGYSVTSLIAGLGIGGIAFALAAQDTINNLFGSITIFSDKPFKLGDWIEIGDFEGIVEEVGFRSTRIRRFDEAQVTIPNKEFITRGIINYSSRRKRRIKFNLGLEYKTSSEQIRKVVEGIKKIIKEDHRFDHNYYLVYFTEFGDSSLNIFIYCFTKTIVWDEYLKTREEFNLKIIELLEELGVEIAFPSQTIYLEKKS